MKPIFNKTVTLEKYPGKGGWTYAPLNGVDANSKRSFGMVRVHGTIDHYPIHQYNLMPMGDGRLFLPIKAATRKIIKKAAGDTVKIILYHDNSPIDIPHDLQLCLNDDPIAALMFTKLTAAVQKMHIDNIVAAKKMETRANRIARLINELLQ